MTTLDIDPLLRKGFQLLHSRNRDSADQLKALLEETFRQRHGKSVITSKDSFILRKESPIPHAKQASPSSVAVNKPIDIKREITLKVREDEAHVVKRPRLDSPHNVFKSHTPSPTSSLKSESSTKSRKSDESDSDADMNDLAMEIGINCTVCKSFEQTSGNQLVECQECHSLYHQECHKPGVTHQDVTDPRLVWYCAKCCRSIKKQSSLLTSTAGVSNIRPASSSKGASSTSRPSPSKAVGHQRPFPFANLSAVSGRNVGSSNNNASGSNSNTSNSNLRNSSSSNYSKSSSGPPGANSIMSAERRVHLMKKKAAKNAERRKIL